jgi:chromosome segregation ATPase
MTRESPETADQDLGVLAGSDKLQRQEIGQLREEMARQHGRIDELRTQLDLRLSESADLRNIVENVHLQLLERDKEIDDLRAETEWRRTTEEALRAEIEWRRGVEASLKNRVGELEQEIEKMRATRVWRWGERFRSVRRLLLSVGRRSRT